jgi:hypothetical protein
LFITLPSSRIKPRKQFQAFTEFERVESGAEKLGRWSRAWLVVFFTRWSGSREKRTSIRAKTMHKNRKFPKWELDNREIAEIWQAKNGMQ